jgi:hypothetical protein
MWRGVEGGQDFYRRGRGGARRERELGEESASAFRTSAAEWQLRVEPRENCKVCTDVQ